MATQAVVFDWYNTLAAPDRDDFWDNVPALVAEAGGCVDDDALATWWHGHPVEHIEHSTSEEVYRAWQRARFAALLDACAVAEPQRTAVLDRVEEVRYSRFFEVFDDVVEVLDCLCSRGITVGICSNWDWDLERHLVRNGIIDHLDFVVCSAIHGHRKPHPAIFQTVIDHIGGTPEGVLFVGDSWHDDITGAIAAGLRPVHIVRAGDCPTVDAPHDDVPCISDARTVLDLL